MNLSELLKHAYKDGLTTLDLDEQKLVLTHRAACQLFNDSRLSTDLCEYILAMEEPHKTEILTQAYAKISEYSTYFGSIKTPVKFDANDMSCMQHKNNVLDHILVGCPHRTDGEAGSYRVQLRGMVLPPSCDLMYTEPIGMTTGEAKQACAERVVRDGFTHLLLLDDDIYPHHPNWLGMLLEHDLDVVSGVYNIKRNPVMTCSQKLLPTGKRVKVDSTDFGLLPAHIVSGGLVLIKTSVFSRLEKPWFKSVQSEAKDFIITEDIYFSNKCRLAGIPMHIDSRVWAGHLDAEKGITW